MVKRTAAKAGFVSRLQADRYNDKAIPLGGGISIFASIFIIILGSVAVVKFLIAPGHLDWIGEAATIHTAGFMSKIGPLMVLLGCIAALFLLGLTDDKKGLSPGVKLIVQFMVAIVAALFAEIRVEFFIESKIITALISAVWIVLIINAFNFLDNMDGASAGIAIIAGAVLLTSAVLSGQVFVGGLAIVLIGTLAGFLLFNFPPAKIFMGDAGSFVIGFFLGLLTLKTTYYHQTQSEQWYVVFIPLICMAVPLYDFISVTALRISQGKSPFVGDTQHFSHRLRRHGFSDTQTVLILYLATLCTGLGATFLYQVKAVGAVLIFVQTFMILAIIAVFETSAKNDKTSS